MRFSALLLAALLATPAIADDSGKVESGCKAGEGTAKFSVLPVTGKFVKRKTVSAIYEWAVERPPSRFSLAR